MPCLKVCGITDVAFAVEAARRGVGYLGLIFANGSPRRVAPEVALAIAERVRETLPNPPRFVGVFTTQYADEIEGIARLVKLDTIQLHGDYGAGIVTRLKAKGYEVWILHKRESSGAERLADAVLLDGRDGSRQGGTGKCADWSLVAPLKAAGRRVVLAGGISADNIAAAAATGADVIDVNSSLEISPGVKSIERLDSLLNQVLRLHVEMVLR